MTAPLTRARTRAGIRACIERAIAAGEFANDVDSRALTTVFDSFVVGRSTLARDGVGLEVMKSAISLMMDVWDRHAVEHIEK